MEIFIHVFHTDAVEVLARATSWMYIFQNTKSAAMERVSLEYLFEESG